MHSEAKATTMEVDLEEFSTNSASSTTPAAATTGTSPSGSGIADGCGDTKGCFAPPFGDVVTYVSDGTNIVFELYSPLGDYWVGVGYSYDKDMVGY